MVTPKLPYTEAAIHIYRGGPMHEMAEHMALPFTFDDLMVPERVRDELRRAVSGIVGRRPAPQRESPGVRAIRGARLRFLFRGPPRTGKTMAAQVLAREIGVDLFRVNLSQVVNKYIGETEKCVGRLLDAAEESGAVLLFGEADALFGRRPKVKDAHDRYATIEIGNLLRKMERVCDFDDALLRGLHVILDFPMPDPDSHPAT
jgi:SpoVK/Ycf46/Vps4 family AAA+-type ATPase